jgi:hypothetical protein
MMDKIPYSHKRISCEMDSTVKKYNWQMTQKQKKDSLIPMFDKEDIKLQSLGNDGSTKHFITWKPNG